MLSNFYWMSGTKSLITRNVMTFMLRLFKAFVLPHSHYCSLIWHFSGARNRNKTKRILRFIFSDVNSSYDELLKMAKTTRLYSGRNHKMLIVVFKSLFVSSYPKYLKKLFSLPATPNIHKREFLSLPEPRTTANQGHPTTIFGKYLFGRRFEI